MNDDTTLPAEQPQVTAATKFRRGGFTPAAEVIAEAAAAPAASEAPDDPVMAAAIAADENVLIEYGEGVFAGVEPQEGEPTPALSESATPAEPKFKIGGREFGTQEEAWAYAESLEQERLAADAFRQGVEAASRLAPSNPPPQNATPPQPEEIDPEYYTNPQSYFAKREAQIIARAEARIDQKALQRKTHEDTWTQFYSDYPDLASAREFVDFTLQQNWNTLQHVETGQALKQLAEKVRGKLKPIVEARMPKVELPKVRTAASAGGGEQVTVPKTEAKPLNFAQQMRNLKKGRASAR